MNNQLTRYDAARYALAEAVTVDEVKDIRDKSLAMAEYARQANDKDLLQHATEIRCRAERKCGELLRDMDKNTGRAGMGRPILGGDSVLLPKDTATTLAELGIEKHQSSRWQKLAAIPEDKFELAVEAAKEIAGEVTMQVVMGTIATLHTGDEESYTPPEYLESARKVMGGIDLDPASNAMAQENVKAGIYYTEFQDGLTKEWRGKVWMNPPYTARVINTFIDKLAKHFTYAEVTEAIVLTNNNTDTSWWHQAAKISQAVCFTSGRINFLKRDGSKSSPTNGQCFIYFGDNVEAFKDEFSKYGMVMVRA